MTHLVQGGWTALYSAAENGHLRVVEMLLEANAEVNIKSDVRAFSELPMDVMGCMCQ